MTESIGTSLTSGGTLSELLLQKFRQWGSTRIAMRVKKYGIWNELTWKDSFEKTKYFSLGVMHLGLMRGDKVCLIGDNEPELFFGLFGVQAAGGITVGIFPDATASEIKFIAEQSESKFAFVNDQEQVDKMLSLKAELPAIKKVIWWDPKGMRSYKDPWLTSFDSLLEQGREYERQHPGSFERNIEKGNPEDICSMFYTSGTTGVSKGVMLSHGTIIHSVRSILATLPVSADDDTLSFLPPAWFAEPMYGSACHLVTGAKLNFCEHPETLLVDLREVSPVLLMWGPRQWENVASMIQVKINDSGVLRRFLYHLCLPMGYKIADLEMSQNRPNIFWKTLHRITRVLMSDPIKDSFGLTKNRYAITAGSTLGGDTYRLLRAMGIRLRQLYGSTEGGVNFLQRDEDIHPDSVGTPTFMCTLRVSEEGELLVRGHSVFAGYHDNPKATEDVLRDGWFHSGDAIYIDDSGRGHYIDRMSEMGELSSGTKYSPQYVEAQLRFGAYIKDAIVIGGKQRDFVSAIIDIDFESVAKWAERHHVPYTTFVDLSQRPEVGLLVLNEVERVNRKQPDAVHIAKFVLLHKEFDPDEAELTRTRKIRRTYLEERYRYLIEAIYADEKEVQVESSVIYRDGRTGTVTAAIKILSIGVDQGGNRQGR